MDVISKRLDYGEVVISAFPLLSPGSLRLRTSQIECLLDVEGTITSASELLRYSSVASHSHVVDAACTSSSN